MRKGTELNDVAQDHNESPWYREAIFYCVDLARFKDSDGNGYGDFNGLIQQLDYLEWLGIDAIWLLPFYRSPREDNGYDVVDHYEIDPRLGATGDFVKLLREAEHRNMSVMIDLVINHTSNEHRWFRESRDPSSPKRDWYVWTDDLSKVPEYPAIFPPRQKSTWTWQDAAGGWYLHHFYDFEPDLNTTHSDVRTEIRNMVEYWIRLGVAGFRVDGAPFFGEKGERNEQAVHEVLHGIHTWADDIHEDTVLLPEANLHAPELEPYATNGDAQMLLNFLGSQYMFLAMATERAEPLARVVELMPSGGPSFRWLNFLRHQDELTLEQLNEDERQKVLDAFSPDPDTHVYGRGSRRRLAPMLGGDRRRMELAFSLMFAMPGTPLIFAGDEIGMGENLDLPERDAARLPIQWTAEKPNGGFSGAGPENLVTPVLTEGPFGVDQVNVEDERADENSFLHWVRELIATRKRANRSMTLADLQVEIPNSSICMLVYPGDDGHTVVIAHNLAGAPAMVPVSGDLQDAVTLLIDEHSRFDPEGTLDLAPYGYVWWEQTGVPQFSTIEASAALAGTRAGTASDVS